MRFSVSDKVSLNSRLKKNKKSSSPFGFSTGKENKIGAGQTGKTIQDQFTKAQEKFIKQSVTPKPPQEILFQGPRFLPPFVGNMEQVFQSQQTPPGKAGPKNKSINKILNPQKDSVRFEDFIKVSLTPKSSVKPVLGISDKVVLKKSQVQGSKDVLKTLGITDAIKVSVTQRPKQGELFGFGDRVRTSTKTSFVPDPEPEIPNIPPPPPPFGPGKPLRPPPPFYAPKIGLYSYLVNQASGLKKGYSAYGISSDINIKTLPTFSRFSKGKGIFLTQLKEDKRIQELFYGKLKRKSRKSKSKSKGKSKPKTKKLKKAKGKRKR